MYSSRPYDTFPVTTTAGAADIKSGTFPFLNKASTSFSFKESAKSVPEISENPVGCFPGRSTIMSAPIPSTCFKISCSAPFPIETISIIAAIPIIIPSIVKKERGLFERSPVYAVLKL